MASVKLVARFADGDLLVCKVKGKTTYPDALAQMRHEAVVALDEAARNFVALQQVEVDES